MNWFSDLLSNGVESMGQWAINHPYWNMSVFLPVALFVSLELALLLQKSIVKAVDTCDRAASHSKTASKWLVVGIVAGSLIVVGLFLFSALITIFLAAFAAKYSHKHFDWILLLFISFDALVMWLFILLAHHHKKVVRWLRTNYLIR
jgi:hypothetical protein